MPQAVLTTAQLHEAVERLMEHDTFVFDVETTGEHRKDPRRNQVLWISLAGPGFACTIPMGHPNGELIMAEHKVKEAWYDESQPTKSGRGRKKWRTVTVPAKFSPAPEQLWPSEVFDALRPLFFSDRRIVNQNIKFDLLSIAKYFGNVVPPGPYGDTLVGAWLLDPRKTTSRDLGSLAWRFLKYKYEDKGIGKQVEIYPFSMVARYGIADAKVAWLIWGKINEELEAKRLTNVARLEWDVLDGLVRDTEHTGALLDIPAVEKLAEEVEDRLVGVKARIWKVKPGLNMNSPKQVSDFIYGRKKDGGLGLKPIKFSEKTDAPSTDKEALSAYSHIPFVADLLEFSEWDKILGTYLRPWMAMNVDGRIYTNFKQHGTETGRFSSADPNLQNVPRRGDKSKLIRSLFIAPPGHKLVVADYSQIELRVLAHYTRDRTLVQTFLEDRDPHAETAALIFGVAPADVEDWQRDVAKTINFGIVYGAGIGKVMAVAKVSKTKARGMLDTHRDSFSRVYSWKDQVVSEARRKKSVRTLLGRYRPLPHINSAVDDLRSLAERQAVNTLIQGTSADIIKIAMVRLYRTLPEDMHLVLSIHDELVVQAPEERVDETITLMQDAMTGAFQLRVPLVAEAKAGDRWSEAK